MAVISRQLLWKAKQRAAGRCVQCGRRKSTTVELCKVCREKRRERDRRRYHNSTLTAGSLSA